MLSLITSYFLGSFLPNAIRPYALGILGTMFALLITYGALRLDTEKFTDIGLRWQRLTLTKFFGGFVIGTIIFGLIIAAILGFTPMELISKPSIDLWSAILLSSIALIPQAWMEEIAFRSYPLIILQKSYGIRFTIYAGALAFAMYHYIPGGNPLGSLLGTGIWGVVYGLLAVWTKGIAFPTGFHYALNLSQAVVGMKDPYAPIWNLIDGKPENNYFNFEMDQVGLVAQILVLLLTVLLIEFYIRKIW